MPISQLEFLQGSPILLELCKDSLQNLEWNFETNYFGRRELVWNSYGVMGKTIQPALDWVLCDQTSHTFMQWHPNESIKLEFKVHFTLFTAESSPF